MAVEERVIVPTEALMGALELPDTPRSAPNEGCPAQAEAVIYLLAADSDGQAYRPHLPQDSCGRPLNAVVEALEADYRVRDTFRVEI